MGQAEQIGQVEVVHERGIHVIEDGKTSLEVPKTIGASRSN
jgi:hypothetical protein